MAKFAAVFIVFATLLVSAAAFVRQSNTAAVERVSSAHTCAPGCACSGRAQTSLRANGVAFPELLQLNNQWAEAINEADDSYFPSLAKGQAPKYLWVGCADSRVPAEVVTQSEPGQLFVHRNIANQAPIFDTSFCSILEYAVDYLGVEDIVVCGHYECGGVKAASGADKLGDLENWLVNIREVVDKNQGTLASITDANDRHRKAVDLNVEAQCLRLYGNPVLKNHLAKNGKMPTIHGLVFDIKTGTLSQVPVDISKIAMYTSEKAPAAPVVTNVAMAPKKKVPLLGKLATGKFAVAQ